MSNGINGNLAKYGVAGVAIAVIIFMGFLTNKFFQYIESHADKMTNAVEKNTEVISEFKVILQNGYYINNR